METFNKQLENVIEAALASIAKHVTGEQVATGLTKFDSDTAYNYDQDEFRPGFLDSVPEIIHQFGATDNITCFPLRVFGEPENEQVEFIDEYGDIRICDLTDLDCYGIVDIADWLNGTGRYND